MMGPLKFWYDMFEFALQGPAQFLLVLAFLPLYGWACIKLAKIVERHVVAFDQRRRCARGDHKMQRCSCLDMPCWPNDCPAERCRACGVQPVPRAQTIQKR